MFLRGKDEFNYLNASKIKITFIVVIGLLITIFFSQSIYGVSDKQVLFVPVEKTVEQ